MAHQIELVSGLRVALILTSMGGLIFAFTSIILSFRFVPLLAFVVLTLSSTMSIWVQAKAARTGTIKLPISPRDMAASTSTISISAPHNALIASADFVVGTLLLTLHVMSMITENHNHGGIVMLYAIFAMLFATIDHYVLCLLHVRAWRKEIVDRRHVCRRCHQDMNHYAEPAQVAAGDAEGGVVRKTVAVVEQIEGEA